MKRWIWIVLALFLSTGAYFTIRYGLRPRPVPVMNPTEFHNLEEVGVVIYKRLRQNIRAERLVLLGSSEDVKNSAEIWVGLMKAAEADQEKLLVIQVNEALVQNGQLEEQVKESIKAGQLVVLEGLTREVSHFVEGSLSRKLDHEVHHPVLAISTLKFGLNEPPDDNLESQCLDASPDHDGLQRLGCAARKVTRKFAKKKLSVDKIWAVAERHGLKEYLLFVYEPPLTKVSSAESDSAESDSAEAAAPTEPQLVPQGAPKLLNSGSHTLLK